MPKLVTHIAGQETREIPLTKERVTIGRAPDNDVQLDDKAVSNHHAVVITIGNNCYLQDLGSSNGTLVNAAPIQRQALRHGDVILIGRNHFGFFEHSTPEQAPPPKPEAPDPFKLPPLPPAAAKPEHAPRASEASIPQAQRPAQDADLINKLVSTLRSQRQTSKDDGKFSKAHIDAEWPRVLKHAEALKKQIGNNSRLKFFGISERQGEVLIRAQDQTNRFERFILISRQHPERKFQFEAIWLRINGQEDQRYHSADDLAYELVSTLAYLFTE